jgi:hypothetical protein
MKTRTGLGLLGCLLIGSIAYATTSFIDEPGYYFGTGFVGKGDLQTPWGWNAATMQAEATNGNVTFTYVLVEKAAYSVTCEWETVNKTKTIEHSVTKTTHLDANVSYDVAKKTRNNKNGDVTGFILLGASGGTTTTETGSVPIVGGSCPNGGDGLITAVGPAIDEETDLEITPTSSSTLYAEDAAKATGLTAIWVNGVSVKP